MLGRENYDPEELQFSNEISRIWNINDLVLGSERQKKFDTLKDEYKVHLKSALNLKMVIEHFEDATKLVDHVYVLCVV